MSANEPSLLDPFAVSAPDEAAELSALVRTLELAEGFQLIFVRCNQIPQRERLMEEVRSRLPNLNIQTIFFRGPIQHLLDSIQEHLMTPLPDVVFVSGLEFSLPVTDEAQATPLIANLNASRNSLAEFLPCSVVFWVPEYVLTAIAQGSPDFFSVRSSVYFFSANHAEIARLTRQLSTGEFWQSNNLSQVEKQQRIEAIKRLLADYELLPDRQRDRSAELRLLGNLGALFLTLGDYEVAHTYYNQSLRIAVELHDQSSIAVSLHQIGNLHYLRGEFEEALTQYNQAVRLSESLGDDAGAAGTLHQIGRIYHARGDYGAAILKYEQALQLFEKLSDHVGEARSLHQLGMLHQAQGEYDAALAMYERSLSILEKLGDIAGEASSVHQLGMLHQARGEYDAALAMYERSCEVSEKLGDRAGEAISLHQLGMIHQERREYDLALSMYEHALQLAEIIGDQAGAATTRAQLGVLFTQLGEYSKAFTQFCLAQTVFMRLKLPYERDMINELKMLRRKWGKANFDAAWQAAIGTDLPEWLLNNDVAAK